MIRADAEQSPALDALLGQTDPHYYAVFGSGIKGVGPRIPLWSAPASNLTSWTFLGALWEPAANSSLGDVLATGTNGFNFEVSGFFSLPDDDGKVHYFVNTGYELLDLLARHDSDIHCTDLKAAMCPFTNRLIGHYSTRVSSRAEAMARQHSIPSPAELPTMEIYTL